MELKQLLNNFSKDRTILTLLTLMGVVIGLIYALIPAKYITIGSFFIGRAVEESSGYFTYEGYYSQQTSVEYTKTVVGLLESTDIHGIALEKLGIKTDEYTLRKYGKDISVKLNGPQLITLTVKGNNENESVKLWKSITSTLMETTEKVNKESDKNLHINLVSKEPVIKREYKPLYLCVLIGLVAGAFLAVVVIASRKYIKEDF